ncbi:hypothetical protein Leryth_018465 [Lithospermum erythrorhizon]|nr:hypothetical protein Leryth_018465 [Lithospermum erythrorhizon]
MSEFYSPGGIVSGRSINTTTPQMQFRQSLAGVLPDPAAQLLQRRPDLGGKRSLAEFQQQQQQSLGIYLRNVKQRMYQQTSSPINLSPVSSVSSLSNTSSNMNPHYGFPIMNPNNFNVANQESDTKMMNMLQELEKELLDDEDQGVEEISGVINSEWSATFQNLMVMHSTVNEPNPTKWRNLNQQQPQPQQLLQNHPISLSPTSSTSSTSSTSASPTSSSPKQMIIDIASSISESKADVALELLKRLSQMANFKGTPEQRLTAYMVSSLRQRVDSTTSSVPSSGLYSQEHTISTHKLYDNSPCFKLGFMAANLAILEATMDDNFTNKLHVIDFDIGQGGQYVHLLHAFAGKKDHKPLFLKITTFLDFFNRGEEGRLKVVGDTLKALASKIGISLVFNVMSLKVNDLSREKLGLEDDEALAVNLAFKLYKLPDESVTTENLRDEVLRRVKKLSPHVVTVVEQEMNCNTAPFGARVSEVFGYYTALFESLEAAVSRESPDRVRIEEGLGRKMANSIACEGSDRVERCEVFGKWRARMGMAGFRAKPMSQLVADSLRAKLGAMTRGNRGFTVSEQSGGICFGWMGRSLTIASAWH